MAIRLSRWMGCVAVVGLTALLGACGPSKTETALTEENRALREKQGELENRVAGVEGTVNSLNGEVQGIKSRPIVQTPIERDPPTRDRDTPGGGGGGQRLDLGINLFPSGSDALTVEGKKSIDSQVSKLSRGATLRVEGYADTAKPTKGKYKTNEALSQARADSVAKYLRGKGFNVSDATGYGAVTRHGKKPSRRVEIVVQ